MTNFNKILQGFFYLGLFFIPFNAVEVVSFLGEYKREAATLFFLFGIIFLGLFFLFGKKINVPVRSQFFQLIIVFIVWCFISTFFNIETVSTNYFKQTGGINRFIRQYISLILSSIIFFLFYWNVIYKWSINAILRNIRRAFLISLLFVFLYGVLETLYVIFSVAATRPFLDIFDYFPFVEVDFYHDRIRGVSFEPPFLAIYLITISGWMFSYIITSKSLLRLVPTVMILFLTYFSGSRTALIIISFQLLVLLMLFFFNKRYIKYAINAIGIGLISVTSLIFFSPDTIIDDVKEKLDAIDFKSNLTKSVSNQSRWGIQYASLQVFKEHPIVGVGLGQQAYHNRFHYPAWATKNNSEFRYYKDQNIKEFPPGYSMFVRLLTETGIIGTSIFLLLFIIIFMNLAKTYRSANSDIKHLSVVLLISYVGLFINWFQIDSFRLYGFWLCNAVLIKLVQENKTRTQIVSDETI